MFVVFFFSLSLKILQWNLTTYSINSSKKKFIDKLCFISLSIYTLHFTLSYFTWSCRFDPWVGNIPREGDGSPLQDFCLGNPMDRGAWRTAAQRVTNQLDRSWQLNHHHSGKKNKKHCLPHLHHAAKPLTCLCWIFFSACLPVFSYCIPSHL